MILSSRSNRITQQIRAQFPACQTSYGTLVPHENCQTG